MEYIDVKPMTRRQLDDLWEVKATLSSTEFTYAAVRVARDTRYPVDVVYALLGGASPTAAWRIFRGMTRVTLSQAAGVVLPGCLASSAGLTAAVRYGTSLLSLSPFQPAR